MEAGDDNSDTRRFVCKKKHTGGVGKTSHFLALNVNISIRQKLLGLLMKSRMRFRLKPRSIWPWMTLTCY